MSLIGHTPEHHFQELLAYLITGNPKASLFWGKEGGEGGWGPSVEHKAERWSRLGKGRGRGRGKGGGGKGGGKPHCETIIIVRACAVTDAYKLFSVHSS